MVAVEDGGSRFSNNVQDGAFRASGAFVCLDDDRLTVVEDDGALSEFVGYGFDAADPERGLASFVHPEDVSAMRASLLRQWERSETAVAAFEVRVTAKDGSVKWMWLCAERVRRDAAPCVRCVFHDATPQHRMLDDLAASESRYAYILSKTEDAVFEWDCIAGTIDYSPTFKKKFGFCPPHTGYPESLLQSGAVHPADAPRLIEFLHSMLAGLVETSPFEYRLRRSDGQFRWVRTTATIVRDVEGRPARILGLISDIEDQKRSVEAARELALRDPLTGLYNQGATRNLVTQRLEEATERCALVFIDIDDFKDVNDSLGHVCGDAVLNEVALHLRRLFAGKGLVGRIGGDEFLVFLDPAGSQEEVALQMEGLLEVFRRPFACGEQVCFVSASVGVAYSPQDATRYRDLFDKADKAMYAAKNRGKNRWCDWSESVEDRSRALSDAKDDSLSRRVERKPSGTAFEEVLGIIAEGDDAEQVILSSMAHVGRRCDCDRVGVYEAVDDTGRYRCMLQWHSQEAIVLEGEWDTVSFKAAVAGDEDALARLEKGQPLLLVAAGCGSDWLEARGMRAAYACPVVKGDVLRLTVLYEACAPMGLPPADVRRDLELSSEAIGLCFANGRKQEALRRAGIEGGGAVLAGRVHAADETRALRESIERGEERFRIVLRQTKVRVWEYDFATRSIEATESAASMHGYSRVEDVPESLIADGSIDPASAEDLRHLYARLRAGEPQVQADILTRRADGQGTWWERISYTTVYDDQGVAVRAVAVGEDITRQKEMELAYQREVQMRTALSEDMVASSRENLTKNVVELLEQRGRRFDSADGMTHEQLMALGAQAMPNGNDRARYEALLSREALMRAFAQGRDAVSMDYRRRDAQGGLQWANATMRLVRDAMTGDLYGYGVVRDAGESKRRELALPKHAVRDASTNAYDRDTALLIMDDELARACDAGRSCSLLVFGLSRCGTIIAQENGGLADSLMRELAVAVSDAFGKDAALGRLYADEIAVLVDDGRSAQDVERCAAQVCALMAQAWSKRSGGPFLATCRAAHGAQGTALDLYRTAVEVAGDRVSPRSDDRVPDGAARKDSAQEARRLMDCVADLEARQKYLQTHDSLTGLENLAAFRAYRSSLDGESLLSLGVVSLDINGLKSINRRFGNEFGDACVRSVADALTQECPQARAFRLAGDEFLAVFEDLARDAFDVCVEGAKQRLAAMDSADVAMGGVWADANIDLDAMVEHAEELMLANKRRYYSSAPSLRRRGGEFAQEFRASLERGDFRVYLQPKARIGDGSVYGAEALARGVAADGSIVAPARFIPLLEREGLIGYLDLFVFDRVCSFVADRAARGLEPLVVSLNFSRATMLEEDVVETMEDIRLRSGADAGLIEIEITESLGDLERDTVARMGRRIRQKGYRLSLDDFGARYSNVWVLSAIDLDVVKIDKALVDDLLSSLKSRAVLNGFLNACRELGIQSVAEGVETSDQLDVLRDLGCESVQGYYIGKPRPLEDFERLYGKG